MSGLLTLGVVLSAVDSLSPVLGTAIGNLGKLDTKIGAVGANITKLGTASLAIGTAITTPLKGALDDYQNLAAAQGEIASLGIDDSGIKSITKSAREFSNEFSGTTAPEFIKASYDIKSGISSLSDTAVGEFTKTASMTAAATKSSTGEMTSLFATGFGIYRGQFEEFGASTIKGWNKLSAEEKDIKFGEYFSAGIAGSVKIFKTDGAQMSASISALGATATNAGISFSEQLSILGTLQQTMSGSEAATKYKSFLNAAVGASDKLGLSFTDANNKLLSTPEILGKLKEKYGDTLDAMEKDEIKDAFGTDEAVAMIDLLYNKTDTLKSGIEELNKTTANGTKVTKEMAKAMNKGKEFELLGQQMEGVSSLIGGAFAPLALSLSEIIGGVVKSVSSWMQEHETLSSVLFTGIAVLGATLTVLGSVGVAVGAVGMALPYLASGLGAVSGAFGFLGGVIGTVGEIFLMNPIGLIVTAIAAAAYLIYDNWGSISDFFSDMWDSVTAIFSSTIDIIKTYLGWTPIGMIINNWGIISTFFSDLWSGIVKRFFNNLHTIKSAFLGIIDYIKSPYVAFFDFLSSKFEWVTNTIGPIVDKVSSIGGGISDTVSGIGDSIGDSLKAASNFFNFSDDKKENSDLSKKEINNIQSAVPSAASTKGVNQLSIEKTQKEVINSKVSDSNKYMYENNKAYTAEAKVIHNTPTYNISVNNPSSNVDVIKAMKDHERKQKNKSYEDD